MDSLTSIYQSMFNTANLNTVNIKTDHITVNNLAVKDTAIIGTIDSNTINNFGDLNVSGHSTLTTVQASSLEDAFLTNTTIDGLTNTLTNIQDDSLSTLYVKADGTRAMTGSLNLTSATSNLGIEITNTNSSSEWNIHATDDNKLKIKDSNDENPSITLDNTTGNITFVGTIASPTISNPTVIGTLTYTGDLNVNNITAMNDITATNNIKGKFIATIAGTDPQGSIHYYMKSSSDILRWGIGLHDNETGSNSGSNLNIWRYDDSGSFLSSAVQFQRDSGITHFYDTVEIGNKITLNSSAGDIKTLGSVYTNSIYPYSGSDLTIYNNVTFDGTLNSDNVNITGGMIQDILYYTGTYIQGKELIINHPSSTDNQQHIRLQTDDVTKFVVGLKNSDNKLKIWKQDGDNLVDMMSINSTTGLVEINNSASVNGSIDIFGNATFHNNAWVDGNMEAGNLTAFGTLFTNTIAPASGAQIHITNNVAVSGNILSSGYANVSNVITQNGTSGGGNAHYALYTNGFQRWLFGLGGNESGAGNSGSNFYLWRYADNGSFLNHALSINRANGDIDMPSSLQIGQNLYVTGNSLVNGNMEAGNLTAFGTLFTDMISPEATSTVTISTNASINGSLNMNNNVISNLNSPSNASDAATKGYVDASVVGTSGSGSILPDDGFLYWEYTYLKIGNVVSMTLLGGMDQNSSRTLTLPFQFSAGVGDFPTTIAYGYRSQSGGTSAQTVAMECDYNTTGGSHKLWIKCPLGYSGIRVSIHIQGVITE